LVHLPCIRSPLISDPPTNGLRKSEAASARASLYHADADYSGRFVTLQPLAPPASRLSLSKDRAAFIGSVSLETRKQWGHHTSLSLITDYDYYSWVPEMRYTDGVRPTRIQDDDAWSIRTVLRLNIGLGPSAMYASPGY
jgi:hypothetical protein